MHSLQFNQCTVGGDLGDDGLAQRVGNACVCIAEHEVAIVIVDESDLQNPWAPQTNGGGCRPEDSFLFLRRFRDPRDSSRDSFIVLCGWSRVEQMNTMRPVRPSMVNLWSPHG